MTCFIKATYSKLREHLSNSAFGIIFVGGEILGPLMGAPPSNMLCVDLCLIRPKMLFIFGIYIPREEYNLLSINRCSSLELYHRRQLQVLVKIGAVFLVAVILGTTN